MKFETYLLLKLNAEYLGKKILGANGKPFVVELIEVTTGIDPALEIDFSSKRRVKMALEHGKYWRSLNRGDDFGTPEWMKAEQASDIYAEHSYACCYSDMPEVVE